MFIKVNIKFVNYTAFDGKDLKGVEEPREIIAQLGGGCGFNAFDFGPDGYLYAPGFFRDEIVRVDVDSGDTTLIAVGFGIPNALKFDSRGRLHALDSQRGEVLRVDVETGEKELLATLKPNLDNLAFDSHDRLFVSSADDSAIVEVLPGGGTRTVSSSGLSKPGGIAAIGDSLWVADHYALVELDAQTGVVRSSRTSIIGASELAEPLTVSPYGQHLLLSSYFRNAVQVWDPQQGRAVATYEDFITPVNAIAHREGVVVAEALTGRVSLLDETGESGILADGFELPIGLAIRGDELYVGDFLAGTVTRLGPEGERTTVVRDLAGPEGIAFAADGTLLVVEAREHRLLAVDLQNGEKTIVAADLGLGLEGSDIGLTPPTLFFSGVTVAADGTIYLTGDIDNVVIRVDW